MNCEEIKRWIHAWADGELEPKRKRAIDDHLVRCSNCQRAAETADRLENTLRSLAVMMETSHEFEADFWAELSAQQKEPRHSKFFRALDVFIPQPDFAQVVAVFSLALLIGSVSGVVSSMDRLIAGRSEKQTVPAFSLSGHDEFKGVSGSSLAAVYLRMIDERDKAS